LHQRRLSKKKHEKIEKEADRGLLVHYLLATRPPEFVKPFWCGGTKSTPSVQLAEAAIKIVGATGKKNDLLQTVPAQSMEKSSQFFILTIDKGKNRMKRESGSMHD